VGAARFLRGLSSLLDPRRLTVIVNTGDDEVFFGLHVSPDVDTVVYTLAGLINPLSGWGVEGDTFSCLGELSHLYEETWFQLGDKDLATHIFRTDALRRGDTLTAVTAAVARAHGVAATVLPMTDAAVRTFVDVGQGRPLPFQRYLVRGGGRGRVRAIHLRGARRAQPTPAGPAAIRRATFVIIPPSNPLVSIGPILALRGMRRAVRTCPARVAAISPIIAGAPVKGPLHHMLKGLGHEVSPVGVARLYRDLLDVFVLDQRDAELAPRIADLGIRPVVTDTLMTDLEASRRLAATVLSELRQ
jgi:LPPG:FO 2-phospho-L-lactate transferase